MKISAFMIFSTFALIGVVASQPLQHIQQRAVDDSLVETLVARTEPVKKPLKIKPQQDRIIVKDNTKDERTRGGIIIPDTAREKPQNGVVIAKGPGRKR
jgi:hypothetical protein